MINIVLCGGSGTRLWPLSRRLMPKQFLKLFNGKSLFQLTLNRNSKVCSEFLIVSNIEHYFTALDQMEELSLNSLNSNFLLEPIPKNTAPAIALACFALDADDIVLVTPSDHLIKNRSGYIEVLKRAETLAKEDYLVTFGITPTSAETGFGYIEANGEDVKLFHEKPDQETAKRYLKSNLNGDSHKFYWNSGMFMFRVGLFLAELERYSPNIYKLAYEAYLSAKGNNPTRIDLDSMDKIPEDSIDYAVMERSSRVKVVPSCIEWRDLGSFDSLIEEIKSKDAVEVNSSSNFYFSDTKDKIIATIGLKDYIVVDTKDALLISKRGKSQKVKEVVDILKSSSQFSILNSPLIVHRPWGIYEVLIEDSGYKIKRIVVKPNKRLSLQKHFHRNEHWIVVSGTATVTVGDKKYLVRPNESTYIKMGEIHRLENEGKIPVILIEAQVGEYTGEDDIVRVEDDFNR